MLSLCLFTVDPVVIISFTSSEAVHDCLGPSIAMAPTEEALALPRQGNASINVT